jgi:hypothetical protein
VNIWGRRGCGGGRNVGYGTRVKRCSVCRRDDGLELVVECITICPPFLVANEAIRKDPNVMRESPKFREKFCNK